MYLESLKLLNFKNYDAQALELSPKLNCFVGKNGMGKTNLLDSIHYLCMCKSGVMRSSDRILVRHGEAFFRLDGIFKREEKRENIVAKIIGGKSKIIERNKVPYKRISEHIGLLPVVIIAPNDTQLAMEGSEERRRFWDSTISQSDAKYLKNLLIYNKVLAQRNAYLKSTRYLDESLLGIYDQQLLAPAEYISMKRKAFAAIFTPIFETAYRKISNDQEKVSLVYKSKLLEHKLETLLQETREKDKILQRTTQGIHKDDWDFRINTFPVKKFASQGQLKSYVLALKLAQYDLLYQKKIVPPILLLDDIFDKLDNDRVKQLLTLLVQEDFGQVFITDTDENRIEKIIQLFDVDYKKFIVNRGQIIDNA